METETINPRNIRQVMLKGQGMELSYEELRKKPVYLRDALDVLIELEVPVEFEVV